MVRRFVSPCSCGMLVLDQHFMFVHGRYEPWATELLLKCLGQGSRSIHYCGVAVEQEQPDILDKNPPTTTVILKHC
ncbi:uncharacterized protein H6S33_009149 [Morchella sextelata]|uniref:uncharacterized protein n=1 Tax=Morchella sextelata TaxID=1174677 RepID=UPI001D05A910|nr:uncharacterized protein H6S33_009149 [Morchella sextelata]KAH0612769.1 hypothetical protein H6S33_009149 [Morchella sextelata]